MTEAANGGSDTVVATVDYTLPTNVEALYLVGTGLTGTGSAGADTLLSAGGANTLIGLDGDDLYYVNYSGDTVTEAANGGSDTVVATADYTLPANVEALYLIGTGLTGTGSAGADTLLSVAGGGANTLVGLGGDDLYYVNHTADAVTEAANGGYDTVVATVDYTMPANVEALYLIGTGLSGTGSAGADTLLTLGANTLAGAGGNDTFVFVSGQADGAAVADFDGKGAGQSDTHPDLLRLRHRGAGCDLHLARPRPVADSLLPRRPQRNHHARQRRIDPRHRLFLRVRPSRHYSAAASAPTHPCWRGVRCRLAASALGRAIPPRLARAPEKWESVLGKITKDEKLERDNHSKLG